MTGKIIYRAARREDAGLIYRFVRELAEYEKLTHEVVATQADIEAGLFGSNPKAFAIIAEFDGQPAGTAIWYFTYSTFVGRPGIYVEDIFVRRRFRGKGIGKGFFREIAERAAAENCGRIEWAVLNWNTPSIEFYDALGAEAMDGWTLHRLDAQAIATLRRPETNQK